MLLRWQLGCRLVLVALGFAGLHLQCLLDDAISADPKVSRQGAFQAVESGIFGPSRTAFSFFTKHVWEPDLHRRPVVS
jgi:hypothetical protein